MRTVSALAALALSLSGIGCNLLAVMTASDKSPRPDTSEKAKDAEATFWNVFHSGHYAEIQTGARQADLSLRRPSNGSSNSSAHRAIAPLARGRASASRTDPSNDNR